MFQLLFVLFTFFMLVHTSWANDELSKYDLSVRLDDEARVLTGKQIIQFTNHFSKPISVVYFWLMNDKRERNPYVSSFVNNVGYKNGFKPSGIDIVAVKQNERPLNYEYLDSSAYLKTQKFSTKQQLLKIELNKKLQPKESIIFEIEFERLIPEFYGLSDISKSKDTYMLRFGWYPFEVARNEDKWLLDKLQIMPHYVPRLEFTYPSQYKAVLSGDSVTTDKFNDFNTSVASFKQPVLNMTVNLAPQYYLVTGNTSITKNVKNSIDIEVYYRSQKYLPAAQEALAHVKQTLEYYQSKYGSIPQNRVVVVNSDKVGLWGMAASGYIALGDSYFNSVVQDPSHVFGRFREFLIAHEVAHLWAGLKTNINFHDENFLSEGLTNFMAYDYLDQKYGYRYSMYDPRSGVSGRLLFYLGAGMGLTPSFRLTEQSVYHNYVVDKWDEPLKQPNSKSNLATNTIKDYTKGYLVFNQLRSYVGNNVFMKSLNDYFQSANSIFSIDRFKAAVQSNTNLDMDRFFDDWFIQSKSIDFVVDDIDTAVTGNEYVSTIKIKKHGDALSALDLKVKYTDDSQSAHRINQTASVSSLKLRHSQPISGISLDPNHELMEFNKKNNNTIKHTRFTSFGLFESSFDYNPNEEYLFRLSPSIAQKTLLTNLGFGMALKGTDIFTHEWINGISTYDKNGYSGIALFSDLTYKLDRDQSIKFGVTYYSSNFFDTQLMMIHNVFEDVEDGRHGHNYQKTAVFQYGLSRYDMMLDDPVYGLKSMMDWSNPYSSQQASLLFEVAPSGLNKSSFTKFNIVGRQFIHMFDMHYLVPEWGFSYNDNVPGRLYDTMNLRGLRTVPYADHFWIGRLDYLFPLYVGAEDEFYFSHIRGLTLGLFADYGQSVSPNFAIMTAGIELTTYFYLVSDVAFPFTIGYGQVVSSTNDWDQSRVFFSVKVPGDFSPIFGY